jgi:anti-sigma regulatory factor (Ser/Thr protein kinase)
MNPLRVRLPGGPRAASAARAALRDAEVADGLPERVRGDLELLVSELVTNSVRHAGAADVMLGVDRDEERVAVCCCDGGPGFAGRPGEPSLEGGGGFGLVLVDRLAARWGVERGAEARRCCVWFELAA